MKRILLYIVVLLVLLMIPVEASDIGKLRPIEVVSVYRDGAQTVMETDTGDQGRGATAQQALENLKETSTGIIYLDTARYLLLTRETVKAAEELREELKGTVRLCLTAARADLTVIGDYLEIHGELPRLKTWEMGQELPTLSGFEDSLTFLKKVEKSA